MHRQNIHRNKIKEGMIRLKQREKMEKVFQRISYRLYQAKIALACHDEDWLKELARKIRINGIKIDRILEGASIKVKSRKIRKTEANGKGKSNKISKKGNKKALR